ncbi:MULTISPECIES: VOC family protein [unclassified Idiomarina]|uniref:VOC family protein n=1 Tax=unclassified Idiomarina TaxID=2614829 RepID=UPI0008F8BF1F|nr:MULTISPECIES: VOC family protein [unclassified Idiomarina]MAD52863.1 glyoxalase [Idiomarinaceae bacterium]MEC7643748.1 VOC family protein [Pseudomonadota bacterium]OIN01805.1 hypothetical protein BFR57_07040 [Idiomarina sp. MD25a]|tara:strand:+ start:2394 stop:2810 length:417 start_codon:yes stop_codon:yes gene_type:complete
MSGYLSVITLVVDDLNRSFEFYNQVFDWPNKGLQGNREDDTQVAFFSPQGNVKIALWPRESFNRQLEINSVHSPCMGTTMQSLNVESEAAVEALFDRAMHAFAESIKPPHWQPWHCYGAYFKDPDGHLWEITFNPSKA